MTTLVLRRVHLPVYLNQNPPDMANVTLNWNKVVEIDPISSIAKTVTTHPGALAPSASPRRTILSTRSVGRAGVNSRSTSTPIPDCAPS